MSEAVLNWAAVPAGECNIPLTLSSGQNFRWKVQENGEWLGVIANSAVRLAPKQDGFGWQTYPVPDRWDLIERYFALDVDLTGLYRQWARSEPRIVPITKQYAGLRILRQHAEEAFFAFQCASCNTIVKITRTIRALEERAGSEIADIQGQKFYRFPSAEHIAEIPESALRSDLWGFRAPRLLTLAHYVSSRGPGWLYTLRNTGYRAAHAELTSLPGIGAKVADCICIFGLGHDAAVPVDTHVRRSVVNLFRPELNGKSMTPKVYEEIANLVRGKFGPYAGWAQQYLFLESLNRQA